MNNFVKLIISVFFCITLGSLSVVADGSNPKGKPFVKINDELVEVSNTLTSLQDQIDLLVARVDTVEERATALETAVADLQANNILMQTMIDNNATDVSSIHNAISNLESENQNLQSQIDANSIDIESLEAEIAANLSLISSLQLAILALEDDIIDTDNNLQAQIDNNLDLINLMQGEIEAIQATLELKQNIIEGTCPDGQAVIAIDENSISCGEVNAGGIGTILIYTKTTIDTALALNHKNIFSYCEDGYVASGGGFAKGNESVRVIFNFGHVFFDANQNKSREGWRVFVVNENPFDVWVQSIVRCMRLN